jgi:ankyrin repeat protein
VNARDNNGGTALMIAWGKGDTEIVRMLKKAGAEGMTLPRN